MLLAKLEGNNPAGSVKDRPALNIIQNAIKYTPDGGSIVIDGRTLPGLIEVTVKDTGIGISPEGQAVIFEKFGFTVENVVARAKELL